MFIILVYSTWNECISFGNAGTDIYWYTRINLLFPNSVLLMACCFQSYVDPKIVFCLKLEYIHGI